MTDEKICPFMSKSGTQMHTIGLVDSVYCQKERCMAWGDCVRDFHNEYGEPDREHWTGCRLMP